MMYVVSVVEMDNHVLTALAHPMGLPPLMIVVSVVEIILHV
jgi:hypothetical protein